MPDEGHHAKRRRLNEPRQEQEIAQWQNSSLEAPPRPYLPQQPRPYTPNQSFNDPSLPVSRTQEPSFPLGMIACHQGMTQNPYTEFLGASYPLQQYPNVLGSHMYNVDPMGYGMNLFIPQPSVYYQQEWTQQPCLDNQEMTDCSAEFLFDQPGDSLSEIPLESVVGQSAPLVCFGMVSSISSIVSAATSKKV